MSVSRLHCLSWQLFATGLVFATLYADDPSTAGPRAEMDKIASAYAIEILTTDVSFPISTLHGAIGGACGDKDDLEKYIPLFSREFTLYPRELVKRSQLKRVVLCKDLTFAGQRRNAVPDFRSDTLYLDVARGFYNKPYMRKVIHHDYFHMIDYRDDFSLDVDEGWSRLNPADFKYGTGGKGAQDLPSTSILTDRCPGFLNHYSTTAVEEDKAEVFANLVVDPAYVENRAKHESVLKAKVDYLRQSLTSFCPDMNDEFWEKIRKTRRTSD